LSTASERNKNLAKCEGLFICPDERKFLSFLGLTSIESVALGHSVVGFGITQSQSLVNQDTSLPAILNKSKVQNSATSKMAKQLESAGIVGMQQETLKRQLGLTASPGPITKDHLMAA